MVGDTRVDVGGTFTDIVTIDDGAMRVTKTPTTPASPATGVMNRLRKAPCDIIG